MEEKAVNDIMEILTQDGMTTGQAKSVLQKVQLIFSESSKNFLDQSEAKEALRTPCRYDGFSKSAEEKQGEQDLICTPKEFASDEASFDETIDNAEKESIEKAVQDEPTPQEFHDFFVILDPHNKKVIITPLDGNFSLKLSEKKAVMLAGVIQDCVRKL